MGYVFEYRVYFCGKSRWLCSPNLWSVNLAALILHLCSFLALLIFSTIRWDDTQLQVIHTIVSGQPGTLNSTNVSIDTFVTFPALLLSSFFSGMSAIGHLYLLCMGTCCCCRKQGTYEEAILKKKYNPVRWVEYSFSSSIMILILLVLSGVVDIYALIASFGCNFAMILFGDASDRFRVEYERLERRKKYDENTEDDASDEEQDKSFIPDSNDDSAVITDVKANTKLMFWYGSIVGSFPWIVLFTSFISSLINTQNMGISVPVILWTIPFILAGNFILFAVNHVVLIYSGDFERAEFNYHILSLTAKFSLAWQAFGALAF